MWWPPAGQWVRGGGGGGDGLVVLLFPRGTPVSMDQLQPGDVVSFYGGGHSGLYAGNGNVVQATTAGSPVHLAPIS